MMGRVESMQFVYAFKQFVKGSKEAKFVVNHPSLYKVFYPKNASPSYLYAAFKYPIPNGVKAIPDNIQRMTPEQVKKIYGSKA